MTVVRPTWMLVDGSSLIFRAFHGVPASVRSPAGEPVNAVRGFLDALARLVTTREPRNLAVGSDEEWRPARRVALIPSYKAHRVAEPIPPGLIPQMAMIHRVLAAVGVPFVGVAEHEAEDVLASWVSQLPGPIEIVSGDRDLFALIRDPDVRVLVPERGGVAVVDEAEVSRRYGIPGRLYADFAMLRGDPSDGLPGLPGVGAKTAAALVTKYGGIGGLIASGRLSEADCDYLHRAQAVVLPGCDVPVPVPTGARLDWPADATTLRDLAAELGISSSLDRLLAALRATVHG